MDSNKPKKEGVSVKEIEDFARKYKFQVFFCLIFLFSFFFCGAFFPVLISVLTASAGAILGVIFPKQLEAFSKKGFQFVLKQDKVVQIILGVVALVFSVFLSFLIFFILGVHGGIHIQRMATESGH